jgi:hypothetical protein
MPYKVVGNKVMHKKSGKWSIKQTCKNHANAVKAMGLLEGLEKGTIKKSEVGKKKDKGNSMKKMIRKNLKS